jgi:hypothetical protein
MLSLSGSLRQLVAALAMLAISAAAAAVDPSFHRDFNAVWVKHNARFLEQGRVLELLYHAYTLKLEMYL